MEKDNDHLKNGRSVSKITKYFK